MLTLCGIEGGQRRGGGARESGSRRRQETAGTSMRSRARAHRCPCCESLRLPVDCCLGRHCGDRQRGRSAGYGPFGRGAALNPKAGPATLLTSASKSAKCVSIHNFRAFRNDGDFSNMAARSWACLKLLIVAACSSVECQGSSVEWGTRSCTSNGICDCSDMR